MTDATTPPATGTLPDFIDRNWLDRALTECGVAGDASLVDAEFLGWVGTGQMARNGRIDLRWDDPEGRPDSVVVKVPSADPGVASFAFAQGGYLTELRFYEDVASTLDCRVPVCHRTEYRPDDLEFVLLMEDVVDATQGDQFDGLDDRQLDLALGQAVRLHAPRFGDPSLPAALGQRDDEVAELESFAQFVQAAYEAAVPIMVDRLGSGLDDEVIDVFRSVASKAGRWATEVGTAETAIHGDLRADNLLFGDGPDAPEIVVVDWQTVRPGSAAADVAYLISGSIADCEDRLAREADHVSAYLERMATAGVALGRDQFWRAYRLGSIWGLLITAVATMAATRTERGDALFTVMAQRHGWQAVHLDAMSLLT